MRRILLMTTAALTVFAALLHARAQSLRPFPERLEAMPSGPVSGTKITEEYARLVAREAYLRA